MNPDLESLISTLIINLQYNSFHYPAVLNNLNTSSV